MVYEGVYAGVLGLHLLAVVGLVGPTAVGAVRAPGLVRSGRADALRDSARTTRVCANASVLVVVLGAAMLGLGDVGEQWAFSQAWVLASFALWLVAVAVTLEVVVRAEDDAVEAVAAGTDTGPLARRAALGAAVAVLAWSTVVVLMVLKPGA